MLLHPWLSPGSSHSWHSGDQGLARSEGRDSWGTGCPAQQGMVGVEFSWFQVRLPGSQRQGAQVSHPPSCSSFGVGSDGPWP